MIDRDKWLSEPISNFIIKIVWYPTSVCSPAVRLLGSVGTGCLCWTGLIAVWVLWVSPSFPSSLLFYFRMYIESHPLSKTGSCALFPPALVLSLEHGEGLPLFCSGAAAVTQPQPAPSDMTGRLSQGIQSHWELVPTDGKIQHGCKAALVQQNVLRRAVCSAEAWKPPADEEIQMPGGCGLGGISNPDKGLFHRAISSSHVSSPFRLVFRGVYFLACDSGISSIPAFSGTLISSSPADLWNKDLFLHKSLAVNFDMKGEESWWEEGDFKLTLPKWKCSNTPILYEVWCKKCITLTLNFVLDVLRVMVVNWDC